MKVCILGTGSIGSRHMGVLKEAGAEVIPIPVRAERLTQLEAEGYRCARSLEEARELGATAAVVATDTRRHACDAAEALRLGYAVLVEKPLAPTLAEGRPVLTASEATGGKVFVACCLRFDAGIRRFRERLPEVGEVHSVRVECRSYLPDWRPGRDYRKAYSASADEGGVLRDLIHEVDYAVMLFGQPTGVFGRLQRTGRLGIEAEEAAEATWLAPGGARISLELDYLSRFPTRVLRAAGSEAELVLDIVGRRLTLLGPGGLRREEAIGGTRGDMYAAQASAFLAAANGESPGELATLDEGLAALALCDAWRMSAQSGKVEEITK